MGRIEARLQTIAVDPRPLSDHYPLAAAEPLERAAAAAAPLAGARVLYVSAVPLEAADCSRSLVPLLCDLGLEVERAVLHGDAGFQLTARELSDALRGARWEGGEEASRELRESCEAVAVATDLRRFDAVVAHGAAAGALIEGRRSGVTAWTWSTGLDLSQTDQEAWEIFRPLLLDHSRLCFALPGYVPPGIDGERLRIAPPAFDPLAASERELPAAELSSLVREAGIDPARPLVVDVTPLDRWADPLAVLESWRLARREANGLQLAFAGRIDPSDPDAGSVAAEVEAFAGEEPDLHLLGRPSAAQVAALTQIARCVVRCSLGEEFDPALSAAHWRGSAIVAGGASAAAQVRDGEDGYLAEGPEQAAAGIAELANHPGKAVAMGCAGREHARARFAIGRLLADQLDLLGSLLAAAPKQRAGAAA
jgi:trehalose synthase